MRRGEPFARAGVGVAGSEMDMVVESNCGTSLGGGLECSQGGGWKDIGVEAWCLVYASESFERGLASSEVVKHGVPTETSCSLMRMLEMPEDGVKALRCRMTVAPDVGLCRTRHRLSKAGVTGGEERTFCDARES